MPAALGVILWIFARLSQSELVLPLVPVLAANVWHLGVLVGLAAIFMGDSTGFQWLEFPRGGSVLLFAAYMLIAISAMATFGGAARAGGCNPPHWFLLAALVWFPWIYTSANVFLVAWPVRGVAQAVIDWWFTNNLIFVWFTLVGLGTAFYFLPKFAGALLWHNPASWRCFGFVTFILSATWCGIPQGAPVPAWFPAASTFATVMLIIPLLCLAACDWRRQCARPNPNAKGGPVLLYEVWDDGVHQVSVALMRSSHWVVRISVRWRNIPSMGMAQTYMQILWFFQHCHLRSSL